MATNTSKPTQPTKFIQTSKVYTQEFIEWKLATKFPKVPKEVKEYIIQEYYAEEYPCPYNNFESEPRYSRGKRTWGYGWDSVVETFEDQFGDEHMKALEFFIGE